MNLLYTAETWTLLHWILLGLIVVFIFIWVTGNKKLNDIEERIFRVEAFDSYYEYPGGFLLLQVRNILVVAFLIIIFKIL